MFPRINPVAKRGDETLYWLRTFSNSHHGARHNSNYLLRRFSTSQRRHTNSTNILLDAICFTSKRFKNVAAYSRLINVAYSCIITYFYLKSNSLYCFVTFYQKMNGESPLMAKMIARITAPTIRIILARISRRIAQRAMSVMMRTHVFLCDEPFLNN